MNNKKYELRKSTVGVKTRDFIGCLDLYCFEEPYCDGNEFEVLAEFDNESIANEELLKYQNEARYITDAVPFYETTEYFIAEMEYDDDLEEFVDTENYHFLPSTPKFEVIEERGRLHLLVYNYLDDVKIYRVGDISNRGEIDKEVRELLDRESYRYGICGDLKDLLLYGESIDIDSEELKEERHGEVIADNDGFYPRNFGEEAKEEFAEEYGKWKNPASVIQTNKESDCKKILGI